MTEKKYRQYGRWFLKFALYMLENGDEIRQAARKAGVRLVDARYKTEHDAEASGKPTEVLLDRYKKQGGSSDSNHPAPTSPEGQEPLVKAMDADEAAKAAAAKAKAAAAAKAAKAKAEATEKQLSD